MPLRKIKRGSLLHLLDIHKSYLTERDIAKYRAQIVKEPSYRMRRKAPAFRHGDIRRSPLPSLWTNSYFVSTVGGAPLTVIKQYIENQKYV